MEVELSDAGDRPTVCLVNQTDRTITFFVREGFGDGADGGAWGDEKRVAEGIFQSALGTFTGETKPVLNIDRWVRCHIPDNSL